MFQGALSDSLMSNSRDWDLGIAASGGVMKSENGQKASC